MGYERRHGWGGPHSFVCDAEADLSSITNPKVGQMALCLSEGSLWFHNGTTWVELTG